MLLVNPDWETQYPPRIVFTIAKATIPPSPSAEMLAWDEKAGKAGKGKSNLGSPIEGKESKDKDETSKSSKGHGMARDFHRFSINEPADGDGDGDRMAIGYWCSLSIWW